MELFNPKKLKFKFSNSFKMFGVISIVGVIASLVFMLSKPGVNYGIDFRGGIEAHVKFTNKDAGLESLRKDMGTVFKNFNIVTVGAAGSGEYFITAQSEDKENISKVLSDKLNKDYGAEGSDWTIVKLDSVGPKIGAELRKAALFSLLYTCILIALYIYFRFDARYAPGALLSIFHDLTLTGGFLALTQTEFSTSVVAALLTLAGYSINDTVVIFDRIRETEEKLLGKSKTALVDIALNSTLPRTIMTSGTTLISSVVLYMVGGEALEGFALTLIFGIFIGTYSSVFIASPLYLLGNKWFSPTENKYRSAT